MRLMLPFGEMMIIYYSRYFMPKKVNHKKVVENLGDAKRAQGEQL